MIAAAAIASILLPSLTGCSVAGKSSLGDLARMMGSHVDELERPLGQAAARQGRTTDEYAKALLERSGNPAGHAGFLSAETASRTCSLTRDLLDPEGPDRFDADWMLHQLLQQLVDEYRATAPALRRDQPSSTMQRASRVRPVGVRVALGWDMEKTSGLS